MTNMIFSEIYGCYFDIVKRILAEATEGVTYQRMNRIAEDNGFAESALHILPQLIKGEWPLLEKRGELYYSKLSGEPPARPMTAPELSWLASLLTDPRLRLFISDGEIDDITAALTGVEPLFTYDDIVYTDRHLDGDDYSDTNYISNFRAALSVCKEGYPVAVGYESEARGRSERVYYPYKISYSELNDKFRLLCAAWDSKKNTLTKVTLNLGRIISVRRADNPYGVTRGMLDVLYCAPYCNPPLRLEITPERNAPERFMLQFASFERQTEYDPGRNVYTCTLYYDLADETELLIRILGFGPTIKVLAPESFLTQIKQRLKKQLDFLYYSPTGVKLVTD